MKNLNNYLLEKLSINKDLKSEKPFDYICRKLEEEWEFLCLPGDACIDVVYDKSKNLNIYSIKSENGKLYADLVENDPDAKEDRIKTIEIDEKTFNKLFDDDSIEAIINTLDK